VIIAKDFDNQVHDSTNSSMNYCVDAQLQCSVSLWWCRVAGLCDDW
jgi:hypothetical protein